VIIFLSNSFITSFMFDGLEVLDQRASNCTSGSL
jgi:hypothetical protein